MEQPRKDVRDFVNKSKHKIYISSVPKSNENSIEFSLSTWTRSSSKTSQSKFLQKAALYYHILLQNTLEEYSSPVK